MAAVKLAIACAVAAMATTIFMARKDPTDHYSALGVDRRATKGRKIKYVVHPKLQEFCCPVPRDAAGAGAARITDELFASLFGGGGSR